MMRIQGKKWGSLLVAGFLLGISVSGECAVPAAAAETIPAGSEAQLQKLVDLRLVTLPAGCSTVEAGHFTRGEMTDLILQAMERLGLDARGNCPVTEQSRPGMAETLALRNAFRKELENKGMVDDSTLLIGTKPSSEAGDEKKDEDRKYKFSAELRYDYERNSGNRRWDWMDSALRARLFVEAKINDDWHAFGMGEINHHFTHHRKRDDWMENRRIYVKGKTGITTVTAGMYGLTLGEGNIYSSTAKGASFAWGDRPRYEFSGGRTKANGDFASFGIKYDEEPRYYGAAVHYFGRDNWDQGKRTIWDAYYNIDLTPQVQAGFMLLGADHAFGDGKYVGFVTRLSHGSIKSWIKGSQEWDLHYYYQPSGTYIAHTMSGLADYMNGFKGLGFQYQYTVIPNVVLNLEYYNLRELATGDKGRTLWLDVTYFMG